MCPPCAPSCARATSRFWFASIGRCACQDFGRLLGQLYLDPALDVAATLTLLVGTTADICVRFAQYLAWPFRAYRLSRQFNPQAFEAACMDFLVARPEELDEGFGLPLQRLALKQGDTPTSRLQWLLSESVQRALAQSFEASAASSLPVERTFAETKRSEAP